MKIQVKNVGKLFRTRSGEVAALRDVSLEVSEGEFVCIIGPSGCGKSTLLYMLAGLEFPSSGELLVDNQRIQDTSPKRVLIFQDGALFPWLNVQSNIEFGLKVRGVSQKEREQRALELLNMVHLEKFRHAWIHELSGGMRQRVALARALALDPDILLLDEPFGALDAITRDRLHGELQELWSNTKKTMVFITHNVREAVVLSDRVIVMSAHPGQVAAEHRITLPRPRRIDDVETISLARKVSADLKLDQISDTLGGTA